MPARAGRCDRPAHWLAGQRPGRSAGSRPRAGQGAVTLAVVASVRHQDIAYDTLLMSGIPRDAARERVGAVIDQVLTAWREPSRRI